MIPLDQISIIGTTIDNESFIFSNIISLDFSASRFIPANSLTFSAPISDYTLKFSHISLKFNNSLVFNGIVDSQSLSINDSSVPFISISSRSISALMLDNEVKPAIYFKLSSDQLIKDHALPFGVKGALFPFPTTINFIQVKKSSSHWAVIDLFCKQKYNKTPFLTAENFITLNPFSDSIIQFSNSRLSNYIPFSSVKIIDNRTNIISKVFMKTGLGNYGPIYRTSINNPLADKLKVSRVRYFHPPNEWVKDSYSSANIHLLSPNVSSFSIKLTSPFILNAKVGDAASLYLPSHSYSNLYISDLAFSISSKGRYTSLTLLDKSLHSNI